MEAAKKTEKTKKSIVSRFLRWFLMLFVFILTIYASFPLWAKFAINYFAPDNFHVEKLNIGYPTVNSLKINHFDFAINGSQIIQGTLENVQLSYLLQDKKLTDINAELINLSLQPSKNTKKAQALEYIPLPELPFEKVTIKKLNLSGLLLQQLHLSDLIISNKQRGYNIDGTLTLFQKRYDLKAEFEENNAKLSSFNLEAKNGNDHLNLKLKPITQNELNDWSWSVLSHINTQNYFNIEGLEKVSIHIKGDLQLAPNLKIQVYPDSEISMPLILSDLGVDTLFSEQAKNLGITTDLSQLKEPSLLSIRTQQIETIERKASSNNDSYKWTLENSNLSLKLKNPQIELDNVIKKLHLSPLENWYSSSQTLHMDAKSTFSSPYFNYQKDAISANLKDITQEADWGLKLEHSQLHIEQKASETLAKSLKLKINDDFISAYHNSFQSQGKFHVNNIGETSEHEKFSYRIKAKSMARNVSAMFDKKNIALKRLEATTKMNADTIDSEYSAASMQFEKELSAQKIQGSISIDNRSNKKSASKITGKNTIQSLDYRSDELTLSDIKSQFNWSYSKNLLNIRGMAHENKNELPFSYQINTKTGKHQLNLSHIKLPVLTAQSWIPALANYPELEIISGDINVNTLSGNPLELTFDAQTAIKNLGINYEQLNVRGFNLNQVMNSKEQLGAVSTATIDSINLGAGIKITDITFKLTQKLHHYQLKQLQGSALNGSIDIPELNIVNNQPQPFVLNLNSIELQNLLSQLDTKALSISGNFDFKLPIALENKSQQINNGTFKALSSGVIKIDTGKDTSENIAYQALENFHYTKFSGTIHYDKDGNYKIQLHLLGANPNLYDGFPIKLDLNLKGHLPDLLYSMLITGDIAKPVMDKVNESSTDLIQK